ncbi:hypothetical protein ACTA71_007057 [Dictyostelium dimigraforme]
MKFDYENSILFFKLWRNIVIKNKIMEFVRLYNYYYFPVAFDSITSFFDFKNKEYLSSIKFFGNSKLNDNTNNGNNNNNNDNNNDDSLNFEYFKHKIDKSKNLSNQLFKEISNIPNDITLEIASYQEFLNYFQFPINVKTLIINLYGFKFNFNSNNYNNLKHLIIRKGFYNINNIISSESSSSLESLSISHEGKSLQYGNKEDDDNNLENEIVELPKTLKHLKLSSETYNNINFSNSQLKYLNYSFELPDMINVNTLPNTLETLLLNYRYRHQIIENVLPKSLTHLEFDNRSIYNISFGENVLPPNLKILMLPRDYTETLRHLPNSLTILKSGGIFPKSILFQLTSLLKLDLSNCEDITHDDNKKLKTLENILPYSLQILRLTGNSIKSPITIIPDENKNYNLTKLIIPTFNKESLKKIVIPKSIKSIDLNFYDEHDHLRSFDGFNSLESLKLGLTPSFITNDTFPKSLKDLRIFRLDLPFNCKNTLKSNILPISLKYLKVFSFKLENFTSFVNKINVKNKNNKEIIDMELKDYKLPSSIKILEICSSIDVFENWLPESIEVLILSGNYSKIHLPLPSSLHSIYIDSVGSSQILNDQQLVSSLMGILKPINYCSKVYRKLIKKQINK